MMRQTPAAWQTLWPFLSGPSIWAVHFLVCYVTAAVFCAKLGSAADFAIIRTVVAGATAIALAGVAVAGIQAYRQWSIERDFVHDEPTEVDRRQLLGQAGMLLSGLSALAVIYVALPALFIGGCQ